VDRPKQLVSFAQNAEDVVLARTFQPWKFSGSWVDVGAGHPQFDSVTHLFSSFGWFGLNIEPLEAEYQLLCRDRSRDINARCAITSSGGEVQLFVGPEDSRGTSTLVHDFSLGRDGALRPIERVMSFPLQVLLDKHDITEVDFLKIDVEGSELQVIASIDFSRFRARCILVEATEPGTRIPSHQDWEPLLLSAGYVFALFDGLNRFYFHDSETQIGHFLDSPACVFDNYVSYHEMQRTENLSFQLYNAIDELEVLRAAKEQSDTYAKSLERELEILRAAKEQSDTYAKSLEVMRSNGEIYQEALQIKVESLSRQLAEHKARFSKP
jgi:FkbM family methyltransferase